ncbi:MAG TPA: HAD family phosphatase [Solirubrobacteraceae bacterium]|nr:HAD family phosphatase [Solirubrobacteraceae bacterium]
MTTPAATPAPREPRRFDPAAVEVLLCDADGNLFPSEEPAFVASAQVTNRCLAVLGIARRYGPDELRLTSTGRNFRTTIVDLATEAGLADALTRDALERWVAEEKSAVGRYLAQTLKPDPTVLEPLTRLERRFGLAAVSSSALGRLDACFTATGLDALFPPERRFSAEDSLPTPTSKPDPAIYTFAGRALGVAGPGGLAIEDSVPGALSAVAAGFVTIGNVAFVAPEERGERVEALYAAGAADVVGSWSELRSLLT